jgi:predicted kinase
VILDAKYDREKLRREAIAQATSHQIPLEILSCSAPIEVLRDRLLARTGDIADATADLLESQQAAFEPFTEAERVYVKEWQ